MMPTNARPAPRTMDGLAPSNGTSDQEIGDTLTDVTFTAPVNAPIEKVDLPMWCFSLPDHEYQGCSPAHVAAGFTTAPDGTRMSINVEVVGGTILVEHYVEAIGEKDHLKLESLTDIFTATGRSTLYVTWELSVKPLGPGRCELSNHVHSRATPEFLRSLDRQGVPFDVFRTQRRPATVDHVKRETPLFAASIERAALK